MKYKVYDDETLNKLHNVQLEILDEIVRICKKYKLNYFLMGGSMLGAIRHSGFIPWDDDIDIGMMRKDYDLFIKYASKELNSKYFLDCFEVNKEYYLPFAKVKKNNTVFDEESSVNINNHKGIFVDIFPLENASKQDSLIQKIQAILVRTIVDTMFYKNKLRNLKQVNHSVLTFILSILSKKSLMKLQMFLMKLNKNDNSDYVVALSGTYNYQKETNLRSVYLPTKKYDFSGKKYNGLNKPDVYLERVYGDYMTLPPVSKRVNHMPRKIIFDIEEGCSHED